MTAASVVTRTLPVENTGLPRWAPFRPGGVVHRLDVVEDTGRVRFLHSLCGRWARARIRFPRGSRPCALCVAHLRQELGA